MEDNTPELVFYDEIHGITPIKMYSELLEYLSKQRMVIDYISIQTGVSRDLLYGFRNEQDLEKEQVREKVSRQRPQETKGK